MFEIINMTPHTINILANDNMLSFESKGNLRIESTENIVGEINSIPIVNSILSDCKLPDYNKYVFYIVASMVRTRYPYRPDLLSPDTGPTAVRENGNIVAVRRLISNIGNI